MKFEEALAALRKGSKITHPHMADDEYFQGCYVGLAMEKLGLPGENLEDIKQK